MPNHLILEIKRKNVASAERFCNVGVPKNLRLIAKVYPNPGRRKSYPVNRPEILVIPPQVNFFRFWRSVRQSPTRDGLGHKEEPLHSGFRLSDAGNRRTVVHLR